MHFRAHFLLPHQINDSRYFLYPSLLHFLQIPAEQFENVWKVEMEKSLNDALFPEEGPLWM